jgi:hypothetical protein
MLNNPDLQHKIEYDKLLEIFHSEQTDWKLMAQHKKKGIKTYNKKVPVSDRC